MVCFTVSGALSKFAVSPSLKSNATYACDFDLISLRSCLNRVAQEDCLELPAKLVLEGSSLGLSLDWHQPIKMLTSCLAAHSKVALMYSLQTGLPE